MDIKSYTIIINNSKDIDVILTGKVFQQYIHYIMKFYLHGN